ncbi:hypothetical protein AVEN_40298-1 [Araneus ventricosus]|uniref:Uncharacterized protein n=1 Tax=Araneus ventricosus TaxID=182803 RepID=A0A4Y2UK83_ARAVE|nr:hypothetical protein AVEN_170101-1 [Araneus ventricosus]GBO13453.1 hypothetical protein AVEN_40298-1 [Araneus ventricosus]
MPDRPLETERGKTSTSEHKRNGKELALFRATEFPHPLLLSFEFSEFPEDILGMARRRPREYRLWGFPGGVTNGT